MSDQPTEKPDAPAPAAGEQDGAIVESKPEQTDLSAEGETKKEGTEQIWDDKHEAKLAQARRSCALRYHVKLMVPLGSYRSPHLPRVASLNRNTTN